MIRRPLVLIALPFAAAALCGSTASAEDAAPNTLTDAEKSAGWTLLFDGHSTDGWRQFGKAEMSTGWMVVDGALTRVAKGAGDIITIGEYDNFELLIDYKISKEGNSGLMFHVTEEGKTPWMTGPEIQVQDNVNGHDPQLAGWLYQLYKPDTDATRPFGEWNTLRFVCSTAGSTVWMNGVKYYEFTLGSDDWNERVAKSKFASMPGFGKAAKGRIALQDHGNWVAYRNIKLRPITQP
jgi:hypothetical protein